MEELYIARDESHIELLASVIAISILSIHNVKYSERCSEWR